MRRDEKILNSIFQFDLEEYKKSEQRVTKTKYNFKDEIENHVKNESGITKRFTDKSNRKLKITNNANLIKTIKAKIGTEIFFSGKFPPKNACSNPISNYTNSHTIKADKITKNLKIRCMKLDKTDLSKSPAHIIKKINRFSQKRQLRFTYLDSLKLFYFTNCIRGNLKVKKQLYDKSSYSLKNFLEITFIIRKH